MKRVDNSELLSEIRGLKEEVKGLSKKIDDMQPYIDTLEDIKSAGKVFTWVVGILTAIVTTYMMLKQAFPGAFSAVSFK